MYSNLSICSAVNLLLFLNVVCVYICVCVCIYNKHFIFRYYFSHKRFCDPQEQYYIPRRYYEVVKIKKRIKHFQINILFHFEEGHTERKREAETQAEGEAGSMHREPDVGFDPGSPGSRPGPKAGAKPLRHPGIPIFSF
ncbi:unnamed protein product [Nyctereutes procyonoides]|uniref:(raccoon dog) hypothetical protein n=1 Tax=Nyctereutes procyonoides TaxID=34880 RepID=A0A811YU22_NYCPR|nr:unnamed protein product [Nyctereutes procyonoides]